MLASNVKSTAVYRALLSMESLSVINADKDLLLILMDNALNTALQVMEL